VLNQFTHRKLNILSFIVASSDADATSDATSLGQHFAAVAQPE